MDLGGIQRTVQIARTRLFGEDDGNAAEMLRGNGSNTDAGRLDGNDFGDVRSVETAAEFTPISFSSVTSIWWLRKLSTLSTPPSFTCPSRRIRCFKSSISGCLRTCCF